MNARAVNIYKEEADVYVGRRSVGMHYGNPFGYIHGDGKTTKSNAINLKLLPQGSTRQDTIEAYRNWLMGTDHQEWEPARREWILARLKDLAGLRLGCFCKPKNCHADVLAELADIAVGGVLKALVEEHAEKYDPTVALCFDKAVTADDLQNLIDHDEAQFSFPETGRYSIRCMEEMNTWWVFDSLVPFAGPFSTKRKAEAWLKTKDVHPLDEV